jgi:predicted Zn-dependent protease
MLLMLGIGPVVWGQEEESAEISLEAYTDTFQEKFFEALKEKGIENFDRASALLQECKQMQPDNPVVDHELAKTLAAAGDLQAAETYARTAVEAEPTEYWYLNTLMNILKAQYRDVAQAAPNLPFQMPRFRINLARWYLDQSEAAKALAQLESLSASPEVEQLRNRAERLADSARGPSESMKLPLVADQPEEGSAPYYMQMLETHLSGKRWEEAREMASEAIETYPLQPFFYFAKGQALLASGKPSEAVLTLEMGEALLLEEDGLAQRFYRALADAHGALGNEEKAQSYRNRLKTGS